MFFISTSKHKAIRVRDLREIQTLQEEVRKLVGDVSALHETNVTLAEDRSRVEYELSQAKRTKEDLTNLNRQNRQEINALESRIRYLNSELERLRINPIVKKVEVDKIVEVESQESIEERRLQESIIDNLNNKILELKDIIRGYEQNTMSTSDNTDEEEMGELHKRLEVYKARAIKAERDLEIITQRYKLNREELEDMAMFIDDLDLFLEENDEDELKHKMATIVTRQEQLVADGKACVCATNWSVVGSANNGKTMMNNQIKLTLRMFNLSCNQLVMKVNTRSNVDSIKNRILSEAKVINKLNKLHHVELAREYVELKLEQAELQHMLVTVRKAKKDREVEQRRILAEQAKLEADIQKEKDKLLKEKEAYLREQQRLLEQQEETDKYEARIKELQDYIDSLNQQAEELDERVNVKCKAGWVYVISNPSLPDMVKVGVTRRLDPYERIKELSSASVPFKMDTHCVVFSEDAFKLETYLHRRFNNLRVNRNNPKKEWFFATLEDVEAVINEVDSTVEFNYTPLNEDFEISKDLWFDNIL